MSEHVKIKSSFKVISDQVYKSKKNINSRSLFAEILLSIVFLIIGLVLVYTAENDFSTLFFSIIFASIGVLLVFICKGNKYEYRTFILSYSVCVLIMGLSFTYSLSYFNVLMSTIDANKFFRIINDSNASIDKLRYVVDATLPVLVWKQIAILREGLNFDGNGPGIYVLSNAMIVALSGVFVTKIANELFGSDAKRLRLVGTLFALCGMGWLFGSLLIRDSYALLLNTLSVWAIVKVLVTPSMKNLFLAIIVSAVSAGLMLYIREKAFYLFFLFALMGFGSWHIKSKFSPAKVLLILLLMALGVLAYEIIESYTSLVTAATTEESIKYTVGSSAIARSGSLGAALVVNQPLPVRIVLGSAYVLIFPIPSWGYFQIGLPEYFLIKGWQGLFMIIIMPLVIYSILKMFNKSERRSPTAAANMFLLFYLIVTVMLVGVTTLETRHHGQFLSAFLVIAAMTKINSRVDKRKMKRVRYSWFSVIAGGHILWLVLRM